MSTAGDYLNDLLDEALDDGAVELEEVQVDLDEIRAALRVDGEMFIEFFLAEQLDLPVPDVHKQIWNLATDQEKSRILLAIPRDHAKTTLAKLLVVWHWLYTHHRFCVYLSSTNAIAKGACKDIVGFLSNQNFVRVFGEVRMVKASEQESLWQFKLKDYTGKEKLCTLRAIGQGQQMRGINIDNVRPDFAVIDDVEDNEIVESKVQQKKLDKWMFGPFLKALARKKRILWLGNMLAKTSLLARLSRAPRWNPVVFGCLVKNPVTNQLQPLWPGKWEIESLKDDFAEYAENGMIETWMCEMMNMPGHGENGFTHEHVNFVTPCLPEDVVVAWITLDPAFGLAANNDESAIAVHAITRKHNIPITVQMIHGRWTDIEVYNQMIPLANYWNAWAWGIEAVAAQKVLITLFSLLAAQDGLGAMIEFFPLLAGKGDPKIQRIKAMAALMHSGNWGIVEGHIDYLTQLLNINMASDNNEDDQVDAVAYGPYMWTEYEHAIRAHAETLEADNDNDSAQAAYGIEVSNV